MSLDADGNGGASARTLVLERDLVVRALPPFLGLGDLLRLSQTNAGCLREVRQGLRVLGHEMEGVDNLTDADVSTIVGTARHRCRNRGSFGFALSLLKVQQSRDPGGHHRTHPALTQFRLSTHAQMRASRERSCQSADQRSYGFEQEQTARTGRGHNDYPLGASAIVIRLQLVVLANTAALSTRPVTPSSRHITPKGHKETSLSALLRERRGMLTHRQSRRQDAKHQKRLRRPLILHVVFHGVLQ